MKITILTDNPNSWIIPFIEELKVYLKDDHEIKHVFDSEQVGSGDILFILSCEKLVKSRILELNKNNIIRIENVPDRDVRRGGNADIVIEAIDALR